MKTQSPDSIIARTEPGTLRGLACVLRSAVAVLAKDLRCEFRVKQAISAILLFAVTSCIAVSFTLSAYGGNSPVSATLLWIVVYFSAMSGLSRSFVREEDMRTAALLRLSTSPGSVYLGKLAFNWLLVTALQIVAVPLLIVFLGMNVSGWAEFAGVMLAGGLALSAGATTAAAMVSKAATKGAVFAVICFPLLAPALAASIHGSSLAMDPRAIMSAAGDIRILASYCGTLITASLMLFRFIWED